MSGELLGRYELMNLLGEGAMGAVYRAKDTRLGRVVALKVMSASLGNSEESIARFEREARSLAALQHPNIVTIYDFPELQGNLCITMELIDGEPLDRVISNRRNFTVDQKLHFMAAICRALHYAHGHGVVHRDLKPSNVLVLPDCTPKIVDFGIAKIMAEKLTRTNTRIGTIAYMSPEQINGKPVNHRSDIFSAGVVLYEFLSLSSPFEASDTTSTMRKILLEPTPRLPESIPGISARIHQVLLTALSKDAAHRYQTAEDMAKELEQCLSTAPANGPQRSDGPQRPPTQPHPQAPPSGPRMAGPVPPPPAKAWAPQQPGPQQFAPQPRGPQQFGPQPVGPVIQPSRFNPQYMHYPGKPKQSSWLKPFLITLGVVLFVAVVIVVIIAAAAASSSSSNNTQTQTAPATDNAPTTNNASTDSPSQAEPQPDYSAMNDQADALYDKKQYAEARPLYVTACNGGSVDACERVGEMLYMGHGVTEDDSAARPYFESTCAKDNAAACAFLGLMYEHGDSVTADPSTAAGYYAKGCAGGVQYACDQVKALCNGGNQDACQAEKS